MSEEVLDSVVNEELMIPESVREAMSEYHDVYLRFKKLEERLDELKDVVKTYMKDTNMKQHKQNGRYFELQTQDRSKMDEDKAVTILKGLGLTDCVVNKEVPNEKGIKKAIQIGTLEVSALAPAVKPNIIYVLQYKEDKSSGGISNA